MDRRSTPVTLGTVLLVIFTGIHQIGLSQNCSLLKATYVSSESRCTATGSVKVTATGGSGTYNYKLQGPSNTDYTSSNVITGLQPGTYILTVKDISTNCTTQVNNVIVNGNYVEPRFGLTETDVTCTNGNDGVVSVTGLQNGRSPYSFKLVAPSTMGVGTASSTGVFSGLKSGTYSVQLIDSCGNIQTRTISIQNYTWSITSATVTFSNCQNYNGQIVLTDSKGNTNASGTAFNGYKYGVARSPGDTVWFTTGSFAFNLGDNRTISLVAKDRCGQVQAKSWTNPVIPSVGANVTISGQNCTTFNAAITGQTNLTNPQYCIFTAAGTTVAGKPCNTTGSFTGLAYGSYCIKVTNTCYDTVISRCFTQTNPTPTVSATSTTSNLACTTFTATVTGQTNLLNPLYCLFDAAGNAISGQPCNTTGVFNNLPYGSYKIKVIDGCTGTVLQVSASAAKKTRSLGSAITTSNITCSTFTALVPGATNFNTPKYCLLDSAGNQVTCNTTGIFNGLPYGKYCVKVTDVCADTTITRCINMTRPTPSGGSLNVSNKVCGGYTVTVSGQKNIFNGQYCLLDQNGNTLACNTTGVFTNVPYGTVCVKTTDGCTATVFKTCLTTAAPTPSVGPAVISNQTCLGFTATISNQQNLFSPSFCLYDHLGHLVGTCNNSGIFNITGYGSYTIKTTDGCTGTVFTSPVSAIKPPASVSAAVTISSQTCSSFAVAVSGQTNLGGASYSLKDNTGTVVATSTNGIFTNVSYGSYCIEIANACHDTVIQRCFKAEPIPVIANVSATPSCSMTATDIAIQVTGGAGPYLVKVYDTLNSLITSASFSGTTTTVKQLPQMASALRYKVVVSGACGKPDTLLVAATPSTITHQYTVTPQCPSSVTANGSGNLVVTATSNLPGLSVTITQKNFSPVNIGYSFHSGNSFTFSNLDATTYVLTYTFTGCAVPVNDTMSVSNYAFPSLAKSSAYQCDNNSFSVGAAVSGGIAPYTYEIIASSPSSPSIITAPQSSPIFSINNHTQYNLIRLRAIDACGNSALNDVSILPLANTIVTADFNCIFLRSNLSTDAVPNATYTWYRKTSATDSTVLPSTTNTYTIPKVMFTDTGWYMVKTSVNAGCLTRLSYFHLDGTCAGLIALPVSIFLSGQQLSDANQLNWVTPNNSGIALYELQRSKGGNTAYETIASLSANPSQSDSVYTFRDNAPATGANIYRLHILYAGGAESYTNVVPLGGNTGAPIISAYPNPVDKVLNINLQGEPGHNYNLSLYNVLGQTIFFRKVDGAAGVVQYHRDETVSPGLYILKVQNMTTGSYITYKIQFK